MQIFDVKIEFLYYNEIIDLIFNGNVRTITCLNQHYLNLCYENKIYKKDVQRFDLIHPDGIGVQVAEFILSGLKNIPKRITGSDLYIKILEKLSENKSSIFLFGDSDEVLTKAIKRIEYEYKGIEILGKQNGYDPFNNDLLINEINNLTPYMIIVGLGAPRQEEWIINNLEKLTASKILAVGGGLRVLANERKRGPMWVQRIGFEWFVRLLEEPNKYWKRYLVGIPLFIYRVIQYKFQLLKEKSY
jgi:N-acetylglucosaminyldiphosphoundecaprenol N-acetyl-beta-D-mannosaminyltransferase